MSEIIKKQYDSLYAVKPNIFGGGQPLEVTTRLKEYVESGKVLDLGGGEGRNALYLAKQGYGVVVADISEVGLYNVLKQAQEQGLRLETKLSDITQEHIADEYDMILNTFVLHHVSTADSIRVIKQSKAATRVGGVNVIVTFGAEGELADRNQKSGRFYPQEDTLRDLYSDWEIKELQSSEILSEARRKDGTQLKNSVVTMVAQR